MIDTAPAVRFGPAGNSERFYEEGHKRTVETFAWQKALGLTAFEYPFGRGIRLSSDAAREIGEAAAAEGVVISAHAPYYINLASPDEETREKGIQYIMDTARLLNLMGGERVILHPGSPKGGERKSALLRCAEALIEARNRLEGEGLADIRLCPETMGKTSVIGTLEETLYLAGLHDSFLPCVDFAHLHAAGGGRMNSPAAFKAVLDQVEAALGLERARAMHAHFSHIEYGKKGEVRHRIFSDPGFGPDFAHLALILARRGYHGVFICESRGTMADDAAQMLEQYQKAFS